jgi:hypothetical protein
MRVKLQARKPVAELRQDKGGVTIFEVHKHPGRSFKKERAPATRRIEHTGCFPVESPLIRKIKQPLG